MRARGVITEHLADRRKSPVWSTEVAYSPGSAAGVPEERSAALIYAGAPVESEDLAKKNEFLHAHNNPIYASNAGPGGSFLDCSVAERNVNCAQHLLQEVGLLQLCQRPSGLSEWCLLR
jgi:hypothetical protein